MEKNSCLIPIDVPTSQRQEYYDNYTRITRNTNRLLLFSADQKIEHMNDDFYGDNIPLDNNDPEHVFKIAQAGYCGAIATHLGLISRYAEKYQSVDYIVKLNGSTHLVSLSEQDPCNYQLWSIDDVIAVKQQTNLPIRGIGITVYLGSKSEGIMLKQAAQAIFQAHQHGLVAIVWMYLRGNAIKNIRNGHCIAGAAGVAASLGADFVKLNVPKDDTTNTSEQWLRIACQAAGTTGVLCSGGPLINETSFLTTLATQLTKSGTAGIAVGRNIHQKNLVDAIAFTKALAELIYEQKPRSRTL